MKSLRLRSSFLALFGLILMSASLANAQPNRTWVSGSTGNDANLCTRSSPCLTFTRAISQTNSGGEINCLDPGDFGTANITIALTIDCGGTFGSILSSSIVINANAGNDVVTIRNMSIDGTGLGTAGIQYLTAKSVHIENVTVSSFTGSCILANTGTSNGQLTLENSTLAGCPVGVNIFTSNSSTLSVDVHRVRITNCSSAGILAANGARVDARDAVISENGIGIDQTGSGVAGSTVLVTTSTLALNGTALKSASGAYLGASGNTFSNNTTAVYNQNGGQIYTGNDNALFGNAATGTTTGVVPKG